MATFIERDIAEVEAASRRALSRLSLSTAERDRICDQFVRAELRGKRTHGLVRIPWVVARLAGQSHAHAIETSRAGALSHYDCSASVGYLAAEEIAGAVLARAREDGLHLAVGGDIFPTGVLGMYLEPLVEAGLVAIAFGTTPALVLADGSETKSLGTNPIAIGVPGGKGHPIICDVTAAPASFGEVLLSRYDEAAFPDDAIVTADGEVAHRYDEVADAGAFAGAVRQPLEERSDRRQFALLSSLQVAAAALTGGAAGRGVFVLLGVDPRRGQERGPDASAEAVLRLAKDLAPAELPGAHGARLEREARARGRVRIPEALWQEIVALG